MSCVKVKICGITRLQDAMDACDLGADILGFNFVPGSPRYLNPYAAREIISALPPFVTRVGIFADEERSEGKVQDEEVAQRDVSGERAGRGDKGHRCAGG